MSRAQFLLCLIGIFSILLTKNVEARSARRLSGEGIIGGDNAREGQFPYQVALEFNGLKACGGSILSERYVITAAHCVIDQNNTFMGFPIKVIAGVIDLNFSNGVEVYVDKIFVPVEYDPVTAAERGVRDTGDIAILKLKKKLNIKGNSKLGKVKLPKKGEKLEGKTATASGFGYNKIDVVYDAEGEPEEVNGVSYYKMRFAKANIISNEACNESYRLMRVREQHICAALEQRDKNRPEGVCSGDSGGPLVYKGVQIGVVSTSPIGCREDSYPAIYTRVSDYLGFISKAVKGNIDDNIRTLTL